MGGVDMILADDTLEAAIQILALRVCADLLDEVGDKWEDYPDIGLDDWRAIQDRVETVAAEMRPDSEDYADAYEVLAARADQ